VALYPFGGRQYVLYNMNDGPARVALRFPAVTPARTWKERMHDKTLATAEVEEGKGPWARREAEVALTLLPFEIALVEAP
jgi:hypothetical protein